MTTTGMLNEIVTGVKNDLSMGLTVKNILLKLQANGSPKSLAEKIVRIAELQINSK